MGLKRVFILQVPPTQLYHCRLRLNRDPHFFVRHDAFRTMYTRADADLLKSTPILPPHNQRQVPESIFYPKVALPRTLKLFLNHV